MNANPAQATEPLEQGSPRKQIAAVHTETAPRIDGRLDDPVWKQAAVVEDFHMIKPREFDVPSERSSIYVAYGDSALYIAARFWDSEPDRIIAKSMRQGEFSLADDLFTVIIDPFNHGRGGYTFDLNSNGVRTEALFTNISDPNYNWQGIWHGAAQRDEKGWTAELEIPFKTLSFDPATDTWGINFGRWLGRNNEQAGWVSRNRSQNPSIAGQLVGLRGINQGIGLDVIPGIRLNQYKTFQNGQTSSDSEPSVDVIYKLTPALTAALTLNTDFSGTSVDARQINLTRFSLFFPEQREFFLQDADIYEFGRIGSRNNAGTLDRVSAQSARPFFSRRIGLSESGQPIDLKAGAKLAGRIGRWDIGFLGVRQDAFAEIDSNDLFVGRIAANVLKESSIGAILTHGDPTSNLDNSLVGLDFRYQNTRLENGGTLKGALWYQQSHTQGLSSENAAFGAGVQWPNNQGFRGEIRFKTVEENYHPGLGFVNRTGIRDYAGELGHTWRPGEGRFRSFYTGLSAQRIETTDGDLETERFFFRTFEMETRDADKLFTWYVHRNEQVNEPFELSTGVSIATGLYSFGSFCTSVATSSHRAMAGNLFTCSGSFYNGDRTESGVGFSWLPNAHFNFVLSYTRNNIRLPQANLNTRLATARMGISFTINWSWETFVQFDNLSDSLGINSILRWTPRAGRELLLIVNHDLSKTDIDNRFQSDESAVTLKWRHTLRF